MTSTQRQASTYAYTLAVVTARTAARHSGRLKSKTPLPALDLTSGRICTKGGRGQSQASSCFVPFCLCRPRGPARQKPTQETARDPAPFLDPSFQLLAQRIGIVLQTGGEHVRAHIPTGTQAYFLFGPSATQTIQRCEKKKHELLLLIY